MGYVEHRLWLDEKPRCLWQDEGDAERDERIGEHEGYLTLFDLANNRYLGNGVPWDQALVPFMTDGLREVIESRFRVVPRCHCDPVWYGGQEWTGSRHKIIQGQAVEIDLDATEAIALQEWRGHVEALRTDLEARHLAAAMQRGAHLVALQELRELDPMERHGAIRTARTVLDAIEVESVVASRQEGRSWTEIGVELGVTKQAARERFMKYDPKGAKQS